MRQRTFGVLLVAGLILAAGFTRYVRAEDKPAASPKKDWARLQVVTYASGLTGLFDPASGKLYVYDSNLENCVIIRELNELGEPLKKLKN
jgi:hypothetical protein